MTKKTTKNNKTQKANKRVFAFENESSSVKPKNLLYQRTRCHAIQQEVLATRLSAMQRVPRPATIARSSMRTWRMFVMVLPQRECMWVVF
jgi:hypothetical protein